MRRMPKFAFVITFVAFGLTACIGTVPVFVTDVDIGNFSLSWYSPPNDRAGSYTMQANQQELYINQAYMTSDGVTHIVLKGTIDSGVPAGLLWSNGPVNGYTGGTYGYDMTTLGGSYGGYGDFKAGTLGASTGGSFAIGSLDFSAEWMMAAPYSAFVIKGLVEDNADVTVTETNNSLNLYSFDYRTDETNGYFTSSNGIRQKITRYSPQSNLDKPNSFRKVNANNPGQSRGGYMLLISKHASPPAAMVEVNYTDGTKKKYSIDYSGVNFKEVELTGINFQIPTPVGSYGITEVGRDSQNRWSYSIDDTIYSGSISVVTNDTTSPSLPAQPLLLRPLYAPIKEKADDGLDPRGNTTNMICEYGFRKLDTSGMTNTSYANRFKLRWEDTTQSLWMYIEYNDSAEEWFYDGDTAAITIYARLRKPFKFPSDSGVPIQEFIFDFTITGTDPVPPP